jgi:hypothetical protein
MIVYISYQYILYFIYGYEYYLTIFYQAIYMCFNILHALEKVLTNKIENARAEKTAIRADAKFGFPTVAITAL